ncbi:MAG: hypothetical protein JWO02_438 [Solirubrobacterales bacterium]|nr:hypothetical protein [Solirubrobacterales bacterium]
MTTGGPYQSAVLTPEQLSKLNKQMLEMHSAAARLWLDMYEQTLESIAGSQEEAASRTDVDWIATVAKARAAFMRELATRHVALGRELLK